MLRKVRVPTEATLDFHPLTAARWPDLERLFGPKGCWCMLWRVPRAEFERLGKGGRRTAFRRRVVSGPVPGILAYAGGEPTAWCAVAPREAHPELARSRVLARIDNEPVWSIVCLFVGRAFRGRGITLPLIEAAVEYARKRGARIVEAYPTATAKRVDAASAYLGTVPMYRRAGFRIAKAPSLKRRIMRFAIPDAHRR